MPACGSVLVYGNIFTSCQEKEWKFWKKHCEIIMKPNLFHLEDGPFSEIMTILNNILVLRECFINKWWWEYVEIIVC